ncbi:MAG: GNAT family N-acetyltransferase [Pseudomonadota bacterium]
MAEIIRTERLTLRPMALRDAGALHAFFSDPAAMAYWSAPHESLEETQAWVGGTVESPPHVTREYVLERDGAVIGKAGIWKAPELGYFLIRPHWGQGLMSEALGALLPRLHSLMDLEIITAEITPENTASAHLLGKLGFTEVRRGEKDHWDGAAWVDTGYYERPRTAR